MKTRDHQRGEGKIGCIVTLLSLSIVGAAALQVVPVLFSNNEFLGAIENIAGQASILPQANIEAKINQKARELNIPEALVPGAIIITKAGDNQSGTCTVRIKYTRKIDFYGVFTYPFETDKTKAIPYMDAR
jgi:hypothetical protein